MSPTRLALASLLVVLASACTNDEEIAKQEYALAHEGPWDIPAETITIGDTQYVPYTGAGPWISEEESCSGSLTLGARLLRDWLPAAFPQIDHIGGYSCRPISGSTTTTSLHATGRALDIMLPMWSEDADNDLGDPIGNWLIEHAEEIGIQYIIWDEWTWNASRTPGDKERLYGGVSPHHDHLHVELSLEASDALTPWFTSAQELPQTSACEPIPAEGGIVEENGPCFGAYGPAAYWRTESVGHGGSLRWTNAYENETPSNWARWQLPVVEAGNYRVEVWTEPGFSVHREARYSIRHAGEEHAMLVDLSAGSGWLSLGVFAFAAGGEQHLNLFDNSLTAVLADQRIAADAVRLTPIDAPEPMLEPGPATIEIVPVHEIFIEELRFGDPTIDDDPVQMPARSMRPAMVSGCSASTSPASTGSATFLLLALVSLVIRRRR